MTCEHSWSCHQGLLCHPFQQPDAPRGELQRSPNPPLSPSYNQLLPKPCNGDVTREQVFPLQSHFWCLRRGLWHGLLADALIAMCLGHLPSAGTPPANKPRSLSAAPRPSSHCSHWADWAVVRQRAGRTSTRGMTSLVQSLTSYCSCLPPSPSLSHKLCLCLTLSTPFFPVFFYFPQRLLICIARCLEPPDRVAQSKITASGRQIASFSSHRSTISLCLFLGPCKLSAPDVMLSGKRVVINFSSLNH